MYARVVFPLALPDALSYSVPHELDGLVRRGVRVRCTLRGKGRVGLVMGLEDALAPGLDRVLSITEVLDSEPILPVHVLDLMEFASDYYLTPIGLLARSVLPSKLLALPPPMIVLGPRALEVLPAVKGNERRLLERLAVAKRLSVPRLRSEGWRAADLEEALQGLVPRHAVRVVERHVGVAGSRAVSALAVSDGAASVLGAGEVRAPGQRRILEWLIQQERPVFEADALAACGCSRAVVAALVSKGLVRRFQQERAREPRRWELVPSPPPLQLTEHQRVAIGAIEASIGGGKYMAALLYGVTGSGKTEVYLRLLATVLERGLQALVLVPEIALTPALAGELSARFARRIEVLHSAMPDGDRALVWERARCGRVDIVAGPRSSLWAPLPRLGLVVVDEEQDSSYKQGEEPRYNARDLALVVGKSLQIPVVLASATPSMETLRLVMRRQLVRLELPERVAGGGLPAVEVVDLAKEKPAPGEQGRVILSGRLRELLERTVDNRHQAILLVNRRGWAPVLLCRACGHHAACGECSIPLTVHHRQRSLLCHYCGFRADIPTRCLRCGGEVLEDVGIGTEKVASKVIEIMPGARVGILDRDTARSPLHLMTTLESFASGAMDVLVGTQMVSKGHHFPRVTLTGVINADNLLGFPDFRGAERTFQLLTQVAGRAGRGSAPGRVVIQSYHPDHHAVACASRHDVAGFAEVELRYREAFRYPPFTRLAVVRFEAADEGAARTAADRSAKLALEVSPALRLVGPALAPIARLRGNWRVHLMLLSPTRAPIREALAAIREERVPRGVHRVIDIDPQTTV